MGGGPEGDGVRFGRLAAKIPARRMTAALERLLTLYAEDRRAGRVSHGVLHACGRCTRQERAVGSRAADARDGHSG